MSAAQIPATPIQARVAAFFDELFPLDPVRATATGDHRFDHTWPDMTEAGREARLAFVDRWEAELEEFDPDRLSAGERADREVLLAELAAMRFADAELREERWDPMSWIYLLGGGIFPILAREFAPPAARLTSIAGRLETMPRLLEVAAGQLQGLGDRPVSKLHTETALKNLPGIAELADDAVKAGEEAEGDADVRAMLPRLRKSDAMLDFCRDELARVEAFCREKNLIGLAEEPLQIMWTPVFLRSFGGALLDSPGPLDKKEKAFFAVTPIPEEWTPEQKESYLREDNDRMLKLLVIHEAVPGHYLQGVFSNRCSSLARTILWSGVFAEGWAVYVTQVMMDAGYGADDPGLWLTHWKFYLRATTNAIIDVKIHTMDMTQDEAIALMVNGGFQEESEARAKWNRARLSSTQLVTYFVGSIEFWDIELERRRQLALEAGGPSAVDAVSAPRVVGGLGDTPGFVYRKHLEEVLAQGSPPMPVIRRLLLEERFPA